MRKSVASARVRGSHKIENQPKTLKSAKWSTSSDKKLFTRGKTRGYVAALFGLSTALCLEREAAL